MKQDGKAPEVGQLAQMRLHAQSIWRPLQKHGYFIFSVIMLLLFVGSVYGALSLLTYDDLAYRADQEVAIHSVGLNQDKFVVDKVMQLQTAGSGPISPDYQTGRDNPFAE